MTGADMSRREYVIRVVRMIALNLALILAITAPLWFTKAFMRANTHILVCVPPDLTPEEETAYVRRYRTPPMWEALLDEVALTVLTYLAWVLLVAAICSSRVKRPTLSERLETWSMAVRLRVAYFLCWTVPVLGTWVLAKGDLWLVGIMPRRPAPIEAFFHAYAWAWTFWLPTIPVLVLVGLCLAGRRIRRRIRELRGRGDAPAG